MIEVSIPGYHDVSLKHLVLDYNGTLAVNGELLDDVSDALRSLANCLDVHIVTADTFGKVRSVVSGVPCGLSILAEQSQAEAKQKYVRNIGSERTVAIGNGRNDRFMLKEASLGIAIVGPEGAAVETMLAADVVCSGILDAFELLLNPKRLIATLRS